MRRTAILRQSRLLPPYSLLRAHVRRRQRYAGDRNGMTAPRCFDEFALIRSRVSVLPHPRSLHSYRSILLYGCKTFEFLIYRGTCCWRRSSRPVSAPIEHLMDWEIRPTCPLLCYWWRFQSSRLELSPVLQIKLPRGVFIPFCI